MSYSVLCIDDDAEYLLHLKIQLKKAHPVFTTQRFNEAVEILRREEIDLVLLDVNLGADHGIECLHKIKKEFLDTDVVMVSGQRDPRLIVASVRAGAADYLCKPFAPEELFAVIEKTKTLKSFRDKQEALIIEGKSHEKMTKLIGSSPLLTQVMEQAKLVRGHNANVLIEGESGTGKELLARSIHNLEDNPKRPFIAINCAAIPENLIESELFGHEKGSFSGAVARKIGKFELADNGDIFLDEINSLKTDLQAKILRVLQEKEIYRVGGNTPIKTNFRVIAAANSELGALVKAGQFRMDLFHRLRVVSLRLPPLKERTEDLPELVAHFLKKHSVNGSVKSVDAQALAVLKSYDWPGNIRELENLLHSLIILSPGMIIEERHLPEWVRSRSMLPVQTHRVVDLDVTSIAGVVPLKIFVDGVEKKYINRVLTAQNGDKSKTAEVLGISRACLYEKIRGLVNG